MIGGVIATYEGDSSWQMEVIGDLQRDRVGFIDEESGDTSVAIVVDTSLQTLSAFTQAVFTSFGVCPGISCFGCLCEKFQLIYLRYVFIA